jgi:hypothetical protein
MSNDQLMPFFRNFTYWIDKRNWKYYFLMVALEMGRPGVEDPGTL